MRTVAVALKAEVSGYIANMKAAAGATKDLGASLTEAAKADKLNEVTRNMAIAGGGMVAFAGYAIKAAADFDAAMSQVSAATHAPTRDLNALRAAALQAGKDTAFSAGEAAQGITELAKAGVEVRDILHGGLAGALSLAAAGEMSVGEAAETAATAMTQFHLAGSSVPHLADLLAAGAGKAQGEVHDLGAALKMSGLVAGQFGISVEETTGTLAAFAKAGLIGSDAGTSLKTMLLRLAAPAGEAGDQMRALGIHAYDTGGKFVGLANLAGQLQKGLSGLTQQQRDQALATIFGSDAIRAANVLYSQGKDGIKGWTDNVDDAGFAADTAARKTDNLKGDLERLHGTMDTIAIQAGSGGAGGLRLVVKAMDSLATSFASMPPIISEVAVGIIGLTGLVLLGSAGWLKYRAVVAETVTQLRAVGPVGAKAAVGLELAGKAAGRAAVAFVALTVLDSILSLFAKADPDAEKLAGSLTKVADQGDLTSAALAKAGLNMKQFGTDLKMMKNLGGLHGAEQGAKIESLMGLVPSLGKMWDSSATNTLARTKALDEALASMVNSGNAVQASLLFHRMADAAREHGMSMADLLTLLPNYQKATGDAAKSTDAQAKAQEEVVKQGDLLGGTWDNLINKAGTLKDAFDSINGSHLTYFDLQRKNVQVTSDLKKALEESHGAVDNSTEKSMAAGDALSTWIRTQRDFIQGTYDEAVANGQTITASDQARQAYDKSRETLINLLIAMGRTRAEAEAVASTLFKMPAVTTLSVVAPTIGGISARLDALQDKLGVISRDYYIRIYTTELKNSKILHDIPERWGGAYEHAATGLLREASMYSSHNPGRYMIAEPGTGGEAFVPRKGNYGRSMSILNRAAGWYGAQVTTGGGGGTVINVGGITIQEARTPELTATAVTEALARFRRNNGPGR